MTMNPNRSTLEHGLFKRDSCLRDWSILRPILFSLNVNRQLSIWETPCIFLQVWDLGDFHQYCLVYLKIMRLETSRTRQQLKHGRTSSWSILRDSCPMTKIG